MIANPYNLNLQLGYEEILHLVLQLSDSHKAKLVKDMNVDASLEEESGATTLAYLKRMTKRWGKRSKSIGGISEYTNEAKKRGIYPFSKIKTVSAGDANKISSNYKINKEAVVGQWPGDESIEELLNMLNK